MRTIARAADLRSSIAEIRRADRRIGFVPTMGNLHAGHHSLIALARERCDVVVASVFVNPTQFGPHEDFARYPRTPEADAAGLAAQGCDVLYLPAIEELYPYGVEQTVRVSVPVFDGILEGAIRPGHFAGVATVVAKLFNLVQPDISVFGQKDYQQLLVVRRMARDLGFPVEIAAAPIVREANGLAMSSRNQYLDVGQRERAGAIHATLLWMRGQLCNDVDPITVIEGQARARLEQAGLVAEYAVIRRADDLGVPTPGQRGLVALAAVRCGSTRLIDNLLLDDGPP